MDLAIVAEEQTAVTMATTAKAMLLGLLLAARTVNQAGVRTAAPVLVESPDGNVRIGVGVCAGSPCYDVSWRGRVLIDRATLGIDLLDGGRLAGDGTITDVVRGQDDTTYEIYPGKSRTARDHYREAVVSFEEPGGSRRRLELIFRAYNDGAAFRYRIPSQANLRKIVITNELSTFAFAGTPYAYTLPLESFTTSYEQRYRRFFSRMSQSMPCSDCHYFSNILANRGLTRRVRARSGWR